MDGPMLRDGAVVFEGGLIIDVGPTREMESRHPDAEVYDYGQAVILPGLVNAHTHLELSLMRPPSIVPAFVDWIIWLLETIRQTHRDSTHHNRSIEAGVEQCLRFGVTTIGDITGNPAGTRSILCTSPIRAVSFGEVRGMAKRRNQIDPMLESAVRGTYQRASSLKLGVSPHAVYSTEPAGFARSLELAKREKLRLTTHLAETADEAVFLEKHEGPFRRLWEYLDAWDEHVPRWPGGPIRVAAELGLLDYPTLLAHVNYCTDEELVVLSKGQASVVYCPRTHAYFQHPPHRWRAMLDAGINVAIGTDSCASSSDLNIVDDLRLVHRTAPGAPAQLLWEMATTRAAGSLCWETGLGSLTQGKYADAVVFETVADDPLTWILENQVFPKEVWLHGERPSH